VSVGSVLSHAMDPVQGYTLTWLAMDGLFEREDTRLTGRKDRAEQNKKAQQAFRKRREERMKELEAAAASLEPMQRKLFQTEDKLAETALVG